MYRRRKDFQREGTATHAQSNSPSFAATVRSNTSTSNRAAPPSAYVATTTSQTHTNNNAAQKTNVLVNTSQPPSTQISTTLNNTSAQQVTPTQIVTTVNATTPTSIVLVKNLTNSVPASVKYKHQNNTPSFASTVKSTLPAKETTGTNSITPSVVGSSAATTFPQTATTSTPPLKAQTILGGENSPSSSIPSVNSGVNSSHSTTVSTPARSATPSSASVSAHTSGISLSAKFKFNPDATPFVPLKKEANGNNIVSPSVTPSNNPSVIVVPGVIPNTVITPQNVQFLPIQVILF